MLSLEQMIVVKLDTSRKVHQMTSWPTLKVDIGKGKQRKVPHVVQASRVARDG